MNQEVETAEVVESNEEMVETQVSFNPFDENNWTAEQQEAQVEQVETQVEETETAKEEAVVETKVEEKKEEEKPVVEATKVEEPAKPNKYLDYIKEGKEDELLKFLSEKKRLETAAKSEVATVADAAEILKLNLQYKYADLNEQDINDIFEEQYTAPEKPEQRLEQTDEEYAVTLEKWKTQVDKIERKMIREAKLAKPELSAQISNLALDDIRQIGAVEQQQQNQKDLETAKVAREQFEKALETEFKSFNGYELKVKNGDAEIPVNYAIKPEEQSLYKQKVAELNVDDYFGNRWFNEEGKPKVKQIMDDLYLLENSGKVFQKIANESASKNQVNRIKEMHNVDISKGSKTTPVKTGSNVDKQVEAIWSA